MQTIMMGRSRFDSAMLMAMDQVLEAARRLTGASLGNLQMVNWKTGCLEIVAEHGFGQEFLTHFARVQATDATCCGRALQGRSQIILEDVEEDPSFPQNARGIMLNAGARSCQSTPLISSSGAFIGIVSTHFPNAHRPSSQEMENMQSLANTAANEIIRRLACQRGITDTLRTSSEALASSKALLRRFEKRSEQET